MNTDFRTDYARFLETKLDHAVPTGLATTSDGEVIGACGCKRGAAA